jgi:LytS/YehU family sensor histidine kinase
MWLPLVATVVLIQWAGIPKSAAWYACGFGAFCLMTSWENAARGLMPLLQDARSQALRSKLAPHFIFNALNTLKAQIATDPSAAEAMTDWLAQLFRQVLEVSDEATIPLKQELAFVEAYLGIEQARLGGRLRVVIDVPEELESAEIPPLSLQVLVENAVKHGVAPLERGGEVRIGTERREGALHLWVEDPGTGVSPNRGTGTALETLRQRLEDPGDLAMTRTDTGFRVSFRWRQA